MCGIFGVISGNVKGFSQKQMDILGQAMIINQFRGNDSTGLFAVDSKGESALHKVLGGPSSMFASKEWEEMKRMIWSDGIITIGHGRAATRGTVKIENAHPFAKTFETGEKLKLVHNGTLDYSQDLEDFHKFDVDSEWIAEMLVRHGTKALSQIRGAMALVWWNEKDKTLHFYRNKERPLHFNRYQDSTGKTIVIASEAASVRFLAERNGLSPMKKDTDCYYFSPNTHYALSLDDPFGNWAILEDIEQPKPQVRKVYTGGYHGYTGFGRDWIQGDEYYMFGREALNKDLRSFNNDLEKLQRRELESVCFIEGAGGVSRITTFHDGSVLSEIVPSAYRYGLKSMSIEDVPATEKNPAATMVVVKSIYHNGREHYTYHALDTASEKKKDLPALIVDDDAADRDEIQSIEEYFPDRYLAVQSNPSYLDIYVDTGYKRLAPHRKMKWTSRTIGNSLVRHSGKVGAAGGVLLTEYRNSADGEITLGQDVMIEVSSLDHMVTNKGRVWRALGFRNQPTMDAYIDVCFLFKDDDDIAKVLLNQTTSNLPLFKGTVSMIVLSTQDRQADSGSWVTVHLCNVKVVEEAALEAA